MKTLLIMRHAKSDYPAGAQNDFDRPLNEHGRKDLPRVGHLLAQYGPRPDAVLASSALRARQTAEGLAAALALPNEALRFDDALYLAPPDALAQRAATFLDTAQTGLLISHNPGLEAWIEQVSGAEVRLPTAGLAAIELGAFSWADIPRASGRLLYFVVPQLIKAITRGISQP